MQKQLIKRTLVTGACLSAALLLPASAAFGQTSSSSPGMTPTTDSMTGSSSSSSSSMSTSGQSSGNTNFVLGSKIMNCHVKSNQGEDLGTISNVVVNPETGHIRYAVLNASGKKVAVPWNALTAKNTREGETPHFTMDTTKDKLANAPKFDSDNLANLSNRTSEEPIFTYYEVVWFPDVLTSEEQKARGSGSSYGSSSARGGSSPYATGSPYGGASPTGGSFGGSGSTTTMPTTGSSPSSAVTPYPSPH